ncbi:GTP cyclohydrolase II [Nocardia nepalensis]|uniref:GTP cyclohydrolase II n=1 Tax=Nocardia nepalensis TaxID=3375448 RepID=UPI003B674C6B
MNTARVEAATHQLAAGGMAIVSDDADRENEADLLLAAEHATPEVLAFFLRHGSGIVCAPMPAEHADRLHLDPMVDHNTDQHRTAFTVSVDHVSTGTGISAPDRAATIRALASPDTRHTDLRRPGHVFPLRARWGGVLKRAGHTEAAVDLTRIAGGTGVAVITELMDPNGMPMTGERLRAFVAEHRLPWLAIADLVQYRLHTHRLVEPSGPARLPTRYGEFTAWSFDSVLDGTEHLALTMGDVVAAGSSPEGVLVRVHSECITGDLLGSLRCDCGGQFDAALRQIAREGVGVLVYLRGHEGRGIGLGHKLRAYALQESGCDTVDANLALGLPVDSREYGVGAAILAQLGVRRIRVITNNPHKYGGLGGFGIEVVGRVPSPPIVTPDNLAYLRTKRDRLGHLFDIPVVPAE